MFKSGYFVFILLSGLAVNAYANDFDIAINNTISKCSDISAELSDLKRMAGINTAITGVGTAAATGATIVGIVKSSVDKELREILARVDEGAKNPPTNPTADEALNVYDKHITSTNSQSDSDTLSKKSKALGHWRTGLMGGATVTNVAGAVIAGNNRVNGDLQSRIDECIKSVDSLKSAIAQARIDNVDTSRATKIATACGEWKYADLSIINNRARGAMISSIVGATTGAVGTITSASANSDGIRAGDEQTEKNLNTTSNVLAGGTAVASGVATIFNATQIAAVKKIVKIADECEGALK